MDVTVEVVLPRLERVHRVVDLARAGQQLAAEQWVREIVGAREDRDVVLGGVVLVDEVNRARLVRRQVDRGGVERDPGGRHGRVRASTSAAAASAAPATSAATLAATA